MQVHKKWIINPVRHPLHSTSAHHEVDYKLCAKYKEMDFSAHMTIRFPLQMHKLDFHAICKWILTFFSSFLGTGDSYHTLSS